MLISSVVSLIISTIVLNMVFVPSIRDYLIQEASFELPEKVVSGKVLGAAAEEPVNLVKQENNNNIVQLSQYNIDKVIVESPKDISDTVVKVMEEVKNIPIPQIPQLPQLDQPMKKLPLNPVKLTGPKLLNTAEFNLLANSGAAIDCQSGTMIFNKRADRPQPIASITKLVTALVFLDHNPGWEAIYQIQPADKREGGRIYLFTGERVKVKDLFYLSLVGSANTATIALVNATGLTSEEFVEKMNLKMLELGLKNTRFHDPSGLDNANISTAREVAKFSRVALANEHIRQASLTKKYEFKTLGGRKKIVYNTDALLDNFPQNGVKIIGGKTGYLNASGHCFVGKFINQAGQEIITVVLGADSNKARFSQTKELVNWIYESYQW